MGSSVLRHESGWETSRTYGRYRPCERHRTQEIRRVPGNRSSEAARIHQPVTALPGEARNVWTALSALHYERAEERPVEFGTPQGVSHYRNLRATPRQAHHSPLGETCALGDQVNGGR